MWWRFALYAKLHWCWFCWTTRYVLRRDFQSETCLRLRTFWLSYVRERKRLLKINAFNIGWQHGDHRVVSSINNRIQNTVNANNCDFQSETRLRLTNAAAQTPPRAVWLVSRTQTQTRLRSTANGFWKSDFSSNANMFRIENHAFSKLKAGMPTLHVLYPLI